MPQTNSSKVMVWIGRVLSALPVLFMLVTGTFALIKPEQFEKDFDKYGFPQGSFQKLIEVEIACAVLYAIPQTAVLGAILLTGYLGGATATHVRAGEPWFLPVIVGVVVWLGIFFRDARVRALVPIRR